MHNKFSSEMKIFILFFLSGISGLVYEVVWLRILTRVLGCTVYATSVILASFMAGLALGSYFSGRYCGSVKNKLRLYAFLEISIGISALVLTFFLKELTPLYKMIYGMVGGGRFSLTLVQSAVMFAILLIPTSLMGATLPVLSAHTKKYESDFSGRVGQLYGLNTMGAFLGVIASGFFLIGSVGESNTIMTAVLINLIVSLMAFMIAKGEAINSTSPSSPPETEAQASGKLPSGDTAAKNRLVLASYGIIGFAAMGYEIIWSRLFQIEVGTSVYAFSLMLAFYLVGMALGSVWGGKNVHRFKDPLTAIAVLQLFIAAYTVCGIYFFTIFPPFLGAEKISMGNIFIMPPLVMLPITFSSGLIFPLILKFYVRGEEDVAGGVGRLYAVNTFGCIAGSLACGFIFMQFLGTRMTLLGLAGLQAAVALLLLKGSKKAAFAFLVPVALLGIFSPDPFFTLANKEAKIWSANCPDKDKLRHFHREGVAATTTAFWIEGSARSKVLFINGTGVTALHPETKMMAHIPLLLHHDPKDMLVICFGMGTTLRSAWSHEGLRCDAVDLVGDTFECFKYFHSNAEEVLSDPRISRYVDDGRNFLLMHDKKYDVITMDPSPPLWSAGTVNLYAKEFFELAKSHLNPDGIMCLWIPPASASEIVMIMRTFNEVFPNTYVFSGIGYPGFYMVGINGSAAPDLSRFELARNDKKIMADITEWGDMFADPQTIKGLLLFDPKQLEFFVRGMRIIVDDRPYTEFPLWRSLNDPLYQVILDAKVAKKIHDSALQKLKQ